MKGIVNFSVGQTEGRYKLIISKLRFVTWMNWYSTSELDFSITYSASWASVALVYTIIIINMSLRVDYFFIGLITAFVLFNYFVVHCGSLDIKKNICPQPTTFIKYLSNTMRVSYFHEIWILYGMKILAPYQIELLSDVVSAIWKLY